MQRDIDFPPFEATSAQPDKDDVDEDQSQAEAPDDTATTGTATEELASIDDILAKKLRMPETVTETGKPNQETQKTNKKNKKR